MYISETKEYRQRLSEMYKEKQNEYRTPDDIYTLMKSENIQGKILDWLQNDGFLYSREYTWDKVYKKG
jgi:ribosomal protein S8